MAMISNLNAVNVSKNSCVIQWNPGNICRPFLLFSLVYLFDSVVGHGLQIGDKPKKLSS